MTYLKEYFKNWNLWDYSWKIIASVVGVWLGLHWGSGDWNTILSIVTCLTGLWCVILVAKGRIFNYYLGIINVIGYAYISYQYQLYGEVMLNALYFLPMQFVGLYIWTKNKNPLVKDAVRIKFMDGFNRTMLAIICLGAVLIYATILEKMGDPLPLLDSTSTVLSIVAMVLMAWRYMEQWVLWVVVDVVSIAMWYIVIDANGARDIALLVMWIAYLINAVYGFLAWIKMYRKQQNSDMFRA